MYSQLSGTLGMPAPGREYLIEIVSNIQLGTYSAN